MDVFQTILNKLIPLSMYIIIGYILGKRFKIDKESFGTVLLYALTPCVFFSAISRSKIELSYILLPIFIFLLSCAIATIFYKISFKAFGDKRANLVAFSSATANTGYFGIPIAIELFDNESLAIYMMSIIGMSIYDVSYGYYIMARGKYSKKESFLRATKVPTLYAFFIGVIFSLIGIEIPHIFDEFFIDIRSTYTVLGMFMVGLGLSSIKKFGMNIRLFNYLFATKFILWPILILSLCILDKYLFGIYNNYVYNALLLMSVVPMASNGVILATLFDNHPEEIASAILISIIFSLFFIPIMIYFFMV